MDPSEKLVSMGLPFGPPRPRASLRFSIDEARRAIEELEKDPGGLLPELREPLLAWLSGIRQHWNPTWVRLGPAGERLIEELSRQPFDRNRFLKLRRIAIENLSTLV